MLAYTDSSYWREGGVAPTMGGRKKHVWNPRFTGHLLVPLCPGKQPSPSKCNYILLGWRSGHTTSEKQPRPTDRLLQSCVKSEMCNRIGKININHSLRTSCSRGPYSLSHYSSSIFFIEITACHNVGYNEMNLTLGPNRSWWYKWLHCSGPLLCSLHTSQLTSLFYYLGNQMHTGVTWYTLPEPHQIFLAFCTTHPLIPFLHYHYMGHLQEFAKWIWYRHKHGWEKELTPME